MRIQLWSYNYDPEPLGIGPVSTTWAKAMTARGHQIDVITAHPHYPKPAWGQKLLPYREIRDGIKVTRLPLKVGRDTRKKRLLQEMSFLSAQMAAVPFLGRPDAVVSVSPSFPALLPAMLHTKVRTIPWFIWLQDILPDGAATTGYVDQKSIIYRLSLALEAKAYESATGIFVLSDSFRENLIEKGVPDSKITVAYNPTTFEVRPRYMSVPSSSEPRILCMGNIGKSQGLAEIVKDFEADPDLEAMGARLIITGSGVAEEEVRSAIRTSRVEMPGLLTPEQLETEICRASIAVVTQAYEDGEFNVPSKLMNYMAAGLPVVASVKPTSEAARLIRVSNSGWLAPRGEFGLTVRMALQDHTRRLERAESGYTFAVRHLTSDSLATRFEARVAPGLA